VSPPGPLTSRAILRGSAPALILATILLLPFLDKAFTMDDTVFLFEAVQAVNDPLHPTAFDMAWGIEPQRISTIVPTGPVMAWLLVPAILAGGSERVAHGVQILLLWLAIVATVALALRLGIASGWAASAGLLLATTPVVLGMAGTAMPDIPAMALGAAGLQQLMAWREDRRARQAILAAFLLGFAALARTHLVLLVGIGVLLVVGDVFSWTAWRAGPWTRWLPLAAAPLVTAAVNVLTQDPAGGTGTIAAAAVELSSTRSLAPNLLAFLVHWALALPFAIPWLLLRGRPSPRGIAFLVGTMAAAAALVRVAHPDVTPWAIAPIAGLGAAALGDVLGDAFRRRDGVQFSLGLWLLVALPAAVYVHLPSKYLLASAPAAAILVARAMAKAPRLGRPLLAATTAAGVLLGIAILRADSAFAGMGRTAARALIAPRVAAGQRVWYAGHWGFQWYAERAGARFFPVRPPLPPQGDVVVASANTDPHIVVWRMDFLVPIGVLESREPGGRLMDRPSGAGFFSNAWGYLPWSWSDSTIDRFDVLQVDYRR